MNTNVCRRKFWILFYLFSSRLVSCIFSYLNSTNWQQKGKFDKRAAFRKQKFPQAYKITSTSIVLSFRNKRTKIFFVIYVNLKFKDCNTLGDFNRRSRPICSLAKIASDFRQSPPNRCVHTWRFLKSIAAMWHLNSVSFSSSDVWKIGENEAKTFVTYCHNFACRALQI